MKMKEFLRAKGVKEGGQEWANMMKSEKIREMAYSETAATKDSG